MRRFASENTVAVGRARRVLLPATALLIVVAVTALILSMQRGTDARSAAAAEPRDEAAQPRATLPPDPDAPLDLPRVPWEGGSDYWKRFGNAERWADPSFFPIGIWFNGVSSDAEAAWDRAHGIDFYIGMWEGTDFGLFERNDLFWVGDKLNDSFDEASPYWPGVMLDDEVDGRFEPAAGLAHLNALNQQVPEQQFSYTNFTQMVIGPDLDPAAQRDYVELPDVVSLDMYWYTIPFCDWTPYRGDGYIDPVPQATCRTASSYGRAMNGLTARDLSDGELRPRWMFLENLNGLSGQEHVGYVSPGQLKGAAMSSIINEARGLVWFNQSFSGPCQTSSALRSAQVEGDAFCGAAQIAAMGEINTQIRELAPVLNTQTYGWDFGQGLDTMLKAHDGSAYIFAMTDGTTGERGFELPPDLAGATTVAVVDEDRELAVRDGEFSDDFADEYAFHIYRVELPKGAGA